MELSGPLDTSNPVAEVMIGLANPNMYATDGDTPPRVVLSKVYGVIPGIEESVRVIVTPHVVEETLTAMEYVVATRAELSAVCTAFIRSPPE